MSENLRVFQYYTGKNLFTQDAFSTQILPHPASTVVRIAGPTPCLALQSHLPTVWLKPLTALVNSGEMPEFVRNGEKVSEASITLNSGPFLCVLSGGGRAGLTFTSCLWQSSHICAQCPWRPAWFQAFIFLYSYIFCLAQPFSIFFIEQTFKLHFI